MSAHVRYGVSTPGPVLHLAQGCRIDQPKVPVDEGLKCGLGPSLRRTPTPAPCHSVTASIL